MWLLAVDTTSRELSVALLLDHRMVALARPGRQEQHSVALFRGIHQVLTEAGVRLAKVDVYAAANGPGAFTALRVGLTVIKGLAEMNNKPIIPVSLLEAVAESATAAGLLVPVVDAYRGQLFGGVYEKDRGELSLRTAEQVLAPREFFGALQAGGFRLAECTLVGPHLERWTEFARESGFVFGRWENVSPFLAPAVAARARKKFESGDISDALRLEANYVRRSDAELLWRGE